MRYVLALCLVLCLVGFADARGKGGGGSSGWQAFPEGATIIVHDGLPLVNRLRVAMGLHPFKRDVNLWKNAAFQADNQARHGFMGHNGCRMDDIMGNGAEGCGPANCVDGPGGWESCCWKESWAYASAAYVDVTYSNGNTQRFCTIHVRGNDRSSGSGSGGGRSRRGRR